MISLRSDIPVRNRSLFLQTQEVGVVEKTVLHSLLVPGTVLVLCTFALECAYVTRTKTRQNSSNSAVRLTQVSSSWLQERVHIIINFSTLFILVRKWLRLLLVDRLGGACNCVSQRQEMPSSFSPNLVRAACRDAVSINNLWRCRCKVLSHPPQDTLRNWLPGNFLPPVYLKQSNQS